MRRMLGRTWALLVLALAGLPGAGWAVAPVPQEMVDAQEWIATRCAGPAAPAPVFSFIVGRRNSAEALKAWEFDRKSERIDEPPREKSRREGLQRLRSGTERRCGSCGEA